MKYGNWGTLQRDEGLLVPSWVSSRPLNSPSGAPPLWNVCYISRCCRCSPVHRRCQLVNAHSLVELAAGIIKLQTGFRPGVLLWGETARSSACQQLIRATLTTASPSTRYPNSRSTHYQPRHQTIQTADPRTTEQTDRTQLMMLCVQHHFLLLWIQSDCVLTPFTGTEQEALTLITYSVRQKEDFVRTRLPQSDLMTLGPVWWFSTSSAWYVNTASVAH